MVAKLNLMRYLWRFLILGRRDGDFRGNPVYIHPFFVRLSGFEFDVDHRKCLQILKFGGLSVDRDLARGSIQDVLRLIWYLRHKDQFNALGDRKKPITSGFDAEQKRKTDAEETQ